MKTLVLLAFTATLTAHAQTASPVLVTAELSSPHASTFFDRLHPKVYYATRSWAVIELSPAQVDLARRAGHAVTVIDDSPGPDGYRLVTKKHAPVSRADVAGVDVLLERDGVMITRGNPSIDGARMRDGLKSVPLRPRDAELDAPAVTGSPVITASTDSLFASIVAKVNPDTVRWFIQRLQNFGTRYAFASTRDSVAQWIKSQFVRMGYTDARRDSFAYNGVSHTNVIAIVQGSGPSEEIVVFGGHHDSYSIEPMISAPGADDNASGTAAVLETARILKQSGYVPEMTVKFVTFAAEEIGLVGSWVDAARAFTMGTKIRVMINHDMISTNRGPFAGSPVNVNYYSGSEAWCELAKQTTDQFSALVGQTGSPNSGGSDSYSYWSQDYPAVYFEEYQFSPVYHSPADTVGNINIDYCAEVIRASAATMLRATTIPDAVRSLDVADRGDGTSLLATWEAGPDGNTAGYRVFVGMESGKYDSSFLVSDTSVIVGGLTADSLYFVGVASLDAQGDQGLIIERSGTPRSAPLTPGDFTVSPDRNSIRLQWLANSERDLLGYNVYRSETAGEQGSLMTPVPITATSYTDDTAQKHVYTYYAVRAVDSLLAESLPTAQLRARLVTLDLGVLLVDETADGSGAPGDPSDQQVDEFYRSLVQGFTVTPYDLKSEAQIGLSDMGAYSTVVWYGEDLSDMASPFAAREEIRKYLGLGGKFLYTGYRPGKAFTGNNATSATYGPGDLMYDIFGIESSELRVFSRFSGAVPIVNPDASYPPIAVDSSKASASNAYHLRQIETIVAASGKTNVYSYDSAYDTSNTFGVSKGKPVGVQHRNRMFTSVILSFPLYYVKQDQAQALMRYVLQDLFFEVTDVEEPVGAAPAEFALEQNYPNPFNPSTSIGFRVPEEGWVTLSVFDVLGREVAVLVSEPKAPGSYAVDFDARGLASGLYVYRLTAGSFAQTRKMLLLR
jgi:hypothetical protein